MDTKLEQIKNLLAHLKADSERNDLQMRECMGRTLLLITELCKKFGNSDDYSPGVKAKVFITLENCRSRLESLYVPSQGVKVHKDIFTKYFISMSTVISDLEILIQVVENKIVKRKYKKIFQNIKEAADRRQNLMSKNIFHKQEIKRPVMQRSPSQCNLDVISGKTYILGDIHSTSSTGTLATTIENLPQALHDSRSEEPDSWNVLLDDICQTISVLSTDSEEELSAFMDRQCAKIQRDPQDLRPKNLKSSVKKKHEVHASLVCRTISVLKMESEVDKLASIEDSQGDPQDLRSENLSERKSPIEDQKDALSSLSFKTYFVRELESASKAHLKLSTTNEVDNLQDSKTKDSSGFKSPGEDQGVPLSQSKDSFKTYFVRELESSSSSTLWTTNEDTPSVDNLKILNDSKTKDPSDFKPPVEDQGVLNKTEKQTSSNKASSINYLWVGKTFGDRRKFLLDWCKMKTLSYGIPMYTFTTSWKSGRALVALIHSFHKDLIEDRFLAKESPRKTLSYGEKIARSLGVSCPTDFAKECLKKHPNQYEIIPFVEDLRSCLESTSVQN